MSYLIKPFDFMLPTLVRFGEEIYTEISFELKKRNLSNPFIITDKILVNLGIVSKITSVLKKDGFENFYIFDEVEPNPRDTTVERAAEIAKEKNADCIIAIGGGSAMDTAKGASIIISCGGIIKNYEGLNKVPFEVLPIFVFPTTVGTGSEVTFWTVIKDTKENYKLSIGSPFIAPTVALVDPTFVENLPASIIAATGMDALTHAIEGYTCKIAEPITDACGIYAIELISKNIYDAVHTDNKDAKANMLLGSLIAGICFGNSDVAACHCMSESLGGLYDTPHGVANAIMLPYTMEFNYVSNLEKFARVSLAMGINTNLLSTKDAAYASVEFVRQLNKDLKIPSLLEIGCKISDIEELSMRSITNVSVDDNPREITQEDFRAIFTNAFNAN